MTVDSISSTHAGFFFIYFISFLFHLKHINGGWLRGPFFFFKKKRHYPIKGVRPSPSVSVRRICAKLPPCLYNTRARVRVSVISLGGIFGFFFQVQLFVWPRPKLIEITYDDYDALIRVYTRIWKKNTCVRLKIIDRRRRPYMAVCTGRTADAYVSTHSWRVPFVRSRGTCVL